MYNLKEILNKLTSEKKVLIIGAAIVDIIINPVAISILYLYDITNVIESRIKIIMDLTALPLWYSLIAFLSSTLYS